MLLPLVYCYIKLQLHRATYVWFYDHHRVNISHVSVSILSVSSQGFLYLDTFSGIFFMLMVVSAATLLAWVYCSFSGKYSNVVQEIDIFSRFVFEHVRTALVRQFMASVAQSTLPATKVSDTKKNI